MFIQARQLRRQRKQKNTNNVSHNPLLGNEHNPMNIIQFEKDITGAPKDDDDSLIQITTNEHI